MHDFSEIMEFIRNQSFAKYIGKTDFLAYYDKHIRSKRGGGRDRVSPRNYRKHFETEADIIKEKCAKGTYKFSPYNEKLIMKGRYRFPRIISIPIVRDRFVLSILNSYLQRRLDVHRRTANSYIKDIQIFIYDNNDRPLYFFKTDFKSFFDSISHSRLLEILSTKLDAESLALVNNAVSTPTLMPGEANDTPISRGIPQGLSISSILAEEYMREFDNLINEEVDKKDGIYVRYVDDVFILSPVQYDWKRLIESNVTELNLSIQLTEHKTKTGILGTCEVDYIGYSFTKFGTGIRQSNIRIFSDRIANRCVKFKQQLQRHYLRPKYLVTDDDFIEFSRLDLNLLISGFRVNKHNYGWLPYFQQITDQRVLYMLDNTVNRLIKDTPLQGKLNSFVESYHALRRRSGIPYVSNFDEITSVNQKRVVLIKMGRIGNDDRLSDAYIEHKFSEMIESLTSNANKDLKELS